MSSRLSGTSLALLISPLALSLGLRAASAQPAEPPPDGAPAADPPAEPATPTAVSQPTAPPVPVVVSIPTPTPTPTPSQSPASKYEGFQFGSYGRVIAGTDLRGGKPESVNVVAHGPRIVEPSYLELDLSYGFESKRGIKLRPVVTLAFDGTLFHDTGDFDAHPALRNMYLESLISPRLSAWVGSKMYRGDDIYLFDYWPLDNQNTVGGGLRYRAGAVDLAGHLGVNRLNVPFQYQAISVANPAQGATTVVQLNRQRMIASASGAYLMDRGPEAINAKVKVHGEVQAIDSGTRRRDDGTLQALPSDVGVRLGAELSLYGMAPKDSGLHRHMNLFARYAKGLASFDELAPPTSFGNDLTTSKASELSFGLSGNWDGTFGNVMIAGLSRRFLDATGDADHASGWEYAVAARPLLAVGGDVYVGADLSYQVRFPQGLNATTLRAEDPSVVQIAPMIVLSPMGPSAYDRPQLRVVYRAAHLNDGARDEYVPDDPRHAYTWVHFLGFEAEWWFNSTYR